MSSLHYHPPPPLYHGGAPPLPPKPNQKILSLILKAMIMTVITLFFFIFLGVAAILLLLATAAVHRHSTPSSVSSNGFSRKDLKSLPQFKFFRGTTTTTTARCHCNETVNNGNECVICLDGIRQGQWCRKLVGCGHMFHKRCVDTWLVKVATCPVCRTRVTLDSGGLAEDRSLWGSGWRNDLRVW